MLSIIEGGVRFIKIRVFITISCFCLCYHCVKYAEIWTFPVPYFPVYRQKDRIVYIFSKYGKVWIPFCLHTGKYKLDKVCILAYFRQYIVALLGSNVIDSCKHFMKIWVVFAICIYIKFKLSAGFSWTER